jgi:hypothetical protein
VDLGAAKDLGILLRSLFIRLESKRGIYMKRKVKYSIFRSTYPKKICFEGHIRDKVKILSEHYFYHDIRKITFP